MRDLAGALSNLGVRYASSDVEAGLKVTLSEAVDWYRRLADENPARWADLASGLNNLGVRYAERGDVQAGLAVTLEAVRWYRLIADVNPAQVPDLASGLNNLGVRYAETSETSRPASRPRSKPLISTATRARPTQPTSRVWRRR